QQRNQQLQPQAPAHAILAGTTIRPLQRNARRATRQARLAGSPILIRSAARLTATTTAAAFRRSRADNARASRANSWTRKRASGNGCPYSLEIRCDCPERSMGALTKLKWQMT